MMEEKALEGWFSPVKNPKITKPNIKPWMPQIKPHPALTFQQELSQLILGKGMDPLFINAEVCQFAEFRGEGKK